MSSVVQRSFTGGEIAPALYARTDQTKYATGVRTMRNFLGQRHGGAANRPGTRFCAELKDSNSVGRLDKFVFNAAQTYLLVWGDRTLRLIQTGGQVVTAGTAAWVTATVYAVADLVTRGGVTYYCTTAHTSGAGTQPGVGANWRNDWYALTTLGAGAIYEIPTPYAAADLAALQMVQSADVVTIVHPSYAPRELKRFGSTRWTLTPVVFGPAIGGVLNPVLSGGGAGAVLYWAITALDATTGEEGLPVFVSGPNVVPSTGTPTTVNWDSLGGAIGYNVYRSPDGSTYGLLGPAAGTPQAKSSTVWVSTAASVTVSTPGYVGSGSQARMAAVAVVADKAYDGVYTITVLGTLTVSGSPGDPSLIVTNEGRLRAYYSRDGEARVDAGVLGTAQSLSADGTVSGAISGSIHVPDNGYTALTIDVVPEANPGYAGVSTTMAVDSTTAPNNKIAWQYSKTGYLDTGLTPDYQSAPPTKSNLFTSADNYPSVVGYFQQRRLYAATNAKPEGVWASRSGVFGSFTTSTPLQDDDLVAFSLVGRQVNAVKHLLDLGRLLLFTAAGEWEIAGDAAGVLTPTAINPKQQLYHGAASCPPIVIGNAAIFLQARGSVVRDIASDVVQGFKGNDLTVFASHLFDGHSIVDWDFQQVPNPLLWAVRDDGTLVSLTYLREQEVWGWHRHDTDGVVERVCVLPEGNEDRLYWLVRRTINGVTKRYVERMESRVVTDLSDPRDLVFMDSALTYDGRNTTAETMTLSGGVLWSDAETLPCTRSVGGFVAGDVGNAVFFSDASGAVILRAAIEAYVSSTVVTVRPSGAVPASLRGVATARWSRAVDVFTGLSHLEGKRVSVLGDAHVVGSPNNSAYPVRTVVGGSITLDAPYAVVHVGLPYLADLETLDIDTPSGPSLKGTRMLVNRVKVLVERTRGGFVGKQFPSASASDQLDKMDELKLRDATDEYNATALRTGEKEVDIAGAWNSNGRIAIRQPDPVPMTVLAVIPQGVFPQPT